MLSRRVVTAGALAVSTVALMVRPSWAQRSSSASSGVSPRMAVLADAWEELGLVYDRTRRPLLQLTVPAGEPGTYMLISSLEQKPWDTALTPLLEHTARVMAEPARSRTDVILKYHVIDCFCGFRPVPNEAWFLAGGHDWEVVIEREAHALDVNINPYWRVTGRPFAELDGDRDSPQWGEIARWRTPYHAT